MNFCSIHGKISSAAQMALILMENQFTHLQDAMFSLIQDGEFLKLIFEKMEEEFHFRWFKNTIPERGKVVYISTIFNHLNLKPSKSF